MANLFSTQPDELIFIEQKVSVINIIKTEAMIVSDSRKMFAGIATVDIMSISDSMFGNIIFNERLATSDSKTFRLFAVKAEAVGCSDGTATIDYGWIVDFEGITLYDCKIVAKDFFDSVSMTDSSPPGINIFYGDITTLIDVVDHYNLNATKSDTTQFPDTKKYDGTWLKLDDMPISDVGLKLRLWYDDNLTFPEEIIIPNIIKTDPLAFIETKDWQGWMVRRDSALLADTKKYNGKWLKEDNSNLTDKIWLTKIKFPTDNIVINDNGVAGYEEGSWISFLTFHIWKPDTAKLVETKDWQGWMVRRDVLPLVETKRYDGAFGKQDDVLFVDKIWQTGITLNADTVSFSDALLGLIPLTHVWKPDTAIFTEETIEKIWSVKLDSFLCNDQQKLMSWITKTDGMSLSDKSIPNIFGFDNLTCTDKLSNVRITTIIPPMTMADEKKIVATMQRLDTLPIADNYFMTAMYLFQENQTFTDIKIPNIFKIDNLWTDDAEREAPMALQTDIIAFTEAFLQVSKFVRGDNCLLLDASVIEYELLVFDTISLADSKIIGVKFTDSFGTADRMAFRLFSVSAEHIYATDNKLIGIVKSDSFLCTDGMSGGAQLLTDSMILSDRMGYKVIIAPDSMWMTDQQYFRDWAVMFDDILTADDFSSPPIPFKDNLWLADSMSMIIAIPLTDVVSNIDSYAMIMNVLLEQSITLDCQHTFIDFVAQAETLTTIDSQSMIDIVVMAEHIGSTDIISNVGIRARDTVIMSDTVTSKIIAGSDTIFGIDTLWLTGILKVEDLLTADTSRFLFLKPDSETVSLSDTMSVGWYIEKQETILFGDTKTANDWIVALDDIITADIESYLLRAVTRENLLLPDTMACLEWIRQADTITVPDVLTASMQIATADNYNLTDTMWAVQFISMSDAVGMADTMTYVLYAAIADNINMYDSEQERDSLIAYEGLATVDTETCQMWTWKPDTLSVSDWWSMAIPMQDDFIMPDICTMAMQKACVDNIANIDKVKNIFHALGIETITVQDSKFWWLFSLLGKETLTTTDNSFSTRMMVRQDDLILSCEYFWDGLLVKTDNLLCPDNMVMSANILYTDILTTQDIFTDKIFGVKEDTLLLEDIKTVLYTISKLDVLSLTDNQSAFGWIFQQDTLPMADIISQYDMTVLKADVLNLPCQFSADSKIVLTDNVLLPDSQFRTLFITMQDGMTITDSSKMLFMQADGETITTADDWHMLLMGRQQDNIWTTDNKVNTKILKTDTLLFADKMVFCKYDNFWLTDFSSFKMDVFYRDRLTCVERISKLAIVYKDGFLRGTDTEAFIDFKLLTDDITMGDSFTVKIWSLKTDGILMLDGLDEGICKPDELFFVDTSFVMVWIPLQETITTVDIISQIAIVMPEDMLLPEQLFASWQITKWETITTGDDLTAFGITTPDNLFTADMLAMAANYLMVDELSTADICSVNFWMDNQEMISLPDTYSYVVYHTEQETITVSDEEAENSLILSLDVLNLPDETIEVMNIFKTDDVLTTDICSAFTSISYWDNISITDNFSKMTWIAPQDDFIMPDIETAFSQIVKLDNIGTYDILAAIKGFIVFTYENILLSDTGLGLATIRYDLLETADNSFSTTYIPQTEIITITDTVSQIGFLETDTILTADEQFNFVSALGQENITTVDFWQAAYCIEYQESIDLPDEKLFNMWFETQENINLADTAKGEIKNIYCDVMTTADIVTVFGRITLQENITTADSMTHRTVFVVSDNIPLIDSVSENMTVLFVEQLLTPDTSLARIFVAPLQENILTTDEKLTNVIFCDILSLWDSGVDLPVLYTGLSGTQQSGSSITRLWGRL